MSTQVRGRPQLKGLSVTDAEIADLAFSKLTGTPTTLSGYGIASPLPVAQGGTATGTAFTSGSIVFAGASGVYAQDNAHLFWDDTNNVLGIGTNTPAETLDIRAANAGIAVVSAAAEAYVTLANASDPTSQLLLGVDSAAGGQLFGGTSPFASAFGNLGPFPVQFGTNNTVRMTIDGTTGYVGVGTQVTSSAPLTIHSTTFLAQDWYTHHGTDYQAPALGVYRSRGTASAPTVVSSLDTLGYLTFYGYNSGDAAYNAGIQFVVKAIGNYTVAGTRTAQLEITSGGTLSLMLGSDAHVGILASSSSLYSLNISGDTRGGTFLAMSTDLTSDLTTAIGTPRLLGQVNTGSTAHVAGVKYGGDSQAAWFSGLKTRASDNDANTVVQSGDGIVRFEGWGADGAAYRSAGYIELQVDGTPGSSDMPGRWVFYTTPDGSATPAEAFRLSSTKVATFAGPAILKGYAVASLPAGTVGMTAYCTDLTAPTYLAAAVGGGAVVGPVFYDGTNWVTV